MSQQDPALLWDDDVLKGPVYRWVKGTHGDNKASTTQADTDAYVRVEKEVVENLKPYMTTNTAREGSGPDAWFSTTRLARQEIFGAAQVGMAQQALVRAMAEDDEEEVGL